MTVEQFLQKPIESDWLQVRRHWNDWRKAKVRSCDLESLHWSSVSGGAGVISPRPFIHGYVWCNKIVGAISHSCQHGPGPHRILVCVTQTDNSKALFRKLLALVGDSPLRRKSS